MRASAFPINVPGSVHRSQAELLTPNLLGADWGETIALGMCGRSVGHSAGREGMLAWLRDDEDVGRAGGASAMGWEAGDGAVCGCGEGWV